ncbi:hypothetical protein LTR97_007554 [Elasticomyces elasticus]|uniref:Uncharacterized protein n=1 Tax=Elasticomyces elasticus TaxID=574655 RepID=A0AAN7ZMV4_9PEZI|nr:hypothetical protein LTR97_007554 [Elasticomyces elasticus]
MEWLRKSQFGKAAFLRDDEGTSHTHRAHLDAYEPPVEHPEFSRRGLHNITTYKLTNISKDQLRHYQVTLHCIMQGRNVCRGSVASHEAMLLAYLVFEIQYAKAAYSPPDFTCSSPNSISQPTPT